MLAPIDIDLARPPAARWAFSDEQRAAACELVDSYVRDLGGADAFGSMASAYASGFVSAEYRAELESVADRIDRSLEEVLLANLYYDAIFAVIGCTAFAIDTPQGPLHARNLDWWTEKNQLAKHTCEIATTVARRPRAWRVGPASWACSPAWPRGASRSR
ncbi:MAG: hypothetical protein JJ863_35200 [Deltaproteobacteria bacterium]|nr:hypothetical protein [Deltaproteobacteria bacterium]